ncbi:uncharacterized protein Hap1MRO34_020754 [Clarias gariepinus]
MAGSGVGAGGVVANQVDPQITALNQQASRDAAQGYRDKRFLQLTCPHTLDLYKPDDFISDEMSSYGSVDFERSSTSSRKEPDAEPAVISRRKERARIRRRRSKVLKAAVKSLAAQALSFQATEMLKPEKKESSSSAAGGPECKMLKTECAGDSTNNMEAAETPETLLTIANPEAEEQSSVEFVHRETLNEEQSGPESAHDHVTNSTEQQEEHVNPPDGAQEEPSCLENPEMKITVQRVDFICSVCKFHSFYKKNFEAHLESEFHKDHFRFLSEHLPKTTVDFLQLYFGNKQKKVEDFVNQIPDHRAAICQLYEDRDRTQGIGMEHFMRKVEAAHCLACDACFPMQNSLLQSHLKSPHHKHNCKLMMEESKNSGLAYARRILSRSSLRKNLRLYRKALNRQVGSEMKPEELAEQRAASDAQAGDLVEPSDEQTAQASEAEGDQEMEQFPEVSAEKARDEDVQEEPEEPNQKELFFDFLDEEEDVEGVELGEEEQEEEARALTSMTFF